MKLIYFLPVVIVLVGGFLYSKKKMKEMADNYANVKDFSQEHPNVARVYIFGKQGIKDEAIHLHKINGETFINYEKPNLTEVHQGEKWQMIMMEQNKKNYIGFYALPGEHTMNISYINSRPGVIYKSVSEYTDKIDFDFAVEENKKYLLSFDTDINKFIFEEVTDI